MSCRKCEAVQLLRNESDFQGPLYYVRVDESDLEVVGCKVHIKALVDKLKGEDTGPIPDGTPAEPAGLIVPESHPRYLGESASGMTRYYSKE